MDHPKPTSFLIAKSLIVGSVIVVSSLLFYLSSLTSIQASTCAGDINSDRIVDLSDFLILKANFLKENFETRANLNNDSIVDISDYLVLIQNFLKHCDASTTTRAYNRTSPWPVPGKVEAEDFDIGGEGQAYHDSTAANQGTSTYRNESVDLRDYSGTIVIGDTVNGEWVEYTLINQTAGSYTLSVRSGSIYAGRTLTFSWNGSPIGLIEVPIVSNWGEHATNTLVVTLPQGEGVLRINFDSDYANLDWLEFSPVSSDQPTPSPTPSGDNSKLFWAPPRLDNPITITLGTGNTSSNLDDKRDYIIKLPNSLKSGRTSLVGGRNIVMIGGHISLPYKELGGSTQRAIYIKDDGGEVPGRIVHIEGILIDASADNGTGGHGDAVSIDADNTIVQLQNIRVDGMWGGQNTAYYDHSDLIQPWGGVKELRVDKFTGNTNYQGFQIPIDNYGPIGRADMRRVNISYKPKSPNDGGYLIWLFHTTNGSGRLSPCSTGDYYPMNFSEFYLHDFKSGRNFGNSIWPEDENTYCGPDIENGVARWTSVANITGEITSGKPPGGDFVPAGAAGIEYVSPGYQ